MDNKKKIDEKESELLNLANLQLIGYQMFYLSETVYTKTFI